MIWNSWSAIRYYPRVKILVVLMLLTCPVLARAQGQFVFNNRIGTEVNARFVSSCDSGGTSSFGSPGSTVLLFGGPVGTSVSQLVPLDPPSTTFRGPAGSVLAGWVVSVTPTVPGVPAGGNASVLLRIVEPYGATIDFGPYTVNGLGGGTATPPNLQLGTSPIALPFIDCPEPSTFILGGLGLTTMLLFRWRTQVASDNKL